MTHEECVAAMGKGPFTIHEWENVNGPELARVEFDTAEKALAYFEKTEQRTGAVLLGPAGRVIAHGSHMGPVWCL